MPDITITISEEGPYIVDGEVALTAPDGRELELPYNGELCRCGRSGNQPFCDGAHATFDFDGTLAN
jgi:CDGSH-type Zn-finger protein